MVKHFLVALNEVQLWVERGYGPALPVECGAFECGVRGCSVVRFKVERRPGACGLGEMGAGHPSSLCSVLHSS